MWSLADHRRFVLINLLFQRFSLGTVKLESILRL